MQQELQNVIYECYQKTNLSVCSAQTTEVVSADDECLSSVDKESFNLEVKFLVTIHIYERAFMQSYPFLP